MQSPFQSAILSFFEKCFHPPFFWSFFLFFSFFSLSGQPRNTRKKKGHHLDDPHAFENMHPFHQLRQIISFRQTLSYYFTNHTEISQDFNKRLYRFIVCCVLAWQWTEGKRLCPISLERNHQSPVTCGTVKKKGVLTLIKVDRLWLTSKHRSSTIATTHAPMSADDKRWLDAS